MYCTNILGGGDIIWKWLKFLKKDNNEVNNGEPIESGQEKGWRFYSNMIELISDAPLVKHDKAGYIVMIAIDNLNDIIKLEGFLESEKLSQDIILTIKTSIPDEILVYHILPNFFIVNLPGFKDSDVYNWVNKFCETDDYKDFVNQRRIPPMMSFGAVAYPKYGKNNNELIMNVQMNCEQNSHLCRQLKITNYRMHKCNDYFQVYCEADRKLYTERMDIENRIRKAVENDYQGFEMYYQPQIDTKTGVCNSAEALIRWRDENGHIFMPNLLIPALESMQLISKVGLWAMNESIWQCKEWIKMGAPPDFSISVNLSGLQLTEEGLAEQILNILNQYGLSPDCLTLELTETSFMHEIQYGIDFFGQIRGYGVSVSIDDFGTGYSALSYLSKLPIDEVKIDSSFIMDMELDQASRSVVEAVISIAHSLGLRVCAEGVETKSQLKILVELGADLLQGYLYSKPISSIEFENKYIIKQDLELIEPS